MTHRGSSRSRAVCIVVGCLFWGALVGACGSDSDSGVATTTSSSEAVCADAQALSASVESLKDVDLMAEGTNGANAALDAVKDDLSALEESVSEALRPDVDAIQTAVAELETAIETLETEGIAPTATAVASVATATRTLVDELGSAEC